MVDEFDMRVKELARLMGVPWPLHAADIPVGEVSFASAHPSLEDEPVSVPATGSNLKSRLFISYLLDGKPEAPLTDEVRAQARHFFGEELVSDARANPGKHRFINLLLNPHYARVSGKDNPLRRLLLLVEEAWEKKSDSVLAPGQGSQYAEAVRTVLTHLDAGELRVAEPGPDGWSPNEWLKKAILLSFRLNANEIMDLESWDRAALGPWFDKVQNKFAGWNHDRFAQAGFRAVPGAIVRHGAFIGKNVVLMPSFVNFGAYVDEGTMVDTWATVGSCAQIGKNVHLSGGAGIGGVLEPLQANPTIIEDECFIGARSEVAEGVVVRKRAVLSMGVFIGKNTPIVDRTRGNAVYRGEVPESAVVMMGTHPENGLTCPQIVKYRDEKTDAATALNEMLRD